MWKTCINVSRLMVASRNIGYAISHKTSFVKWTIAMPSLTNKDNSVFFFHEHKNGSFPLLEDSQSTNITFSCKGTIYFTQKETGIHTFLLFNTMK